MVKDDVKEVTAKMKDAHKATCRNGTEENKREKAEEGATEWTICPDKVSQVTRVLKEPSKKLEGGR